MANNIEEILSLNTDYYAKEVYYETLSKEEICLDIQTLKYKINEIITSDNKITKTEKTEYTDEYVNEIKRERDDYKKRVFDAFNIIKTKAIICDTWIEISENNYVPTGFVSYLPLKPIVVEQLVECLNGGKENDNRTKR